MALIVGVVLAMGVGAFATAVGLDRDRAFYPTVMIVIACIYVLFAAMGATTDTLVLEAAVGSVFVVAATVGFRSSLWIVVAALAGHGIMDIFHGSLIANPGVPAWWPSFCLAYDLAAAAYLAALLLRPVVSAAWGQRHTDASSSGTARASGSSARLPASAIRGRTSMPTT